jgi:hypothetical protein
MLLSPCPSAYNTSTPSLSDLAMLKYVTIRLISVPQVSILTDSSFYLWHSPSNIHYSVSCKFVLAKIETVTTEIC